MSYTLISTVTVGAGGASSIDFTSIPQTYTDLVVVYSLRDNFANVSNDATFLVNGSVITFRQLYGAGVNAGSNNPTQIARPIVGATATANTFGNTAIYIPNYAGSVNKTISVDSVCETNGTESYQTISAGVFSSTAAITSLSLDNSTYTFSQYSTASLYGINRIPTASLGATPTVDYLVVAGGGAGGASGAGGGGGAGGLLTGSAFSVAAGTPITVTVGAGGGGTSTNVPGSSGSNSVFSSLTAIGGGGGGANSVTPNQGGVAGGSGGGAGQSTFKGLGTDGQGNAGGNAWDNTVGYGAGGGGGAGAIGGDGISNAAGNGGNGLPNTFIGVSTYYAGGGGGGTYSATYSTGTSGSGGLGGGGAAGSPTGNNPGNAGATNTGGGGGAGSVTNGSTTSGAGGSGIVIIRYPDTYAAPAAVTGNPMVTFVNGYRVYTWTASGSITF